MTETAEGGEMGYHVRDHLIVKFVGYRKSPGFITIEDICQVFIYMLISVLSDFKFSYKIPSYSLILYVKKLMMFKELKQKVDNAKLQVGTIWLPDLFPVVIDVGQDHACY